MAVSLKKRLILSNIGMVVIPILALIIVELAAGYLFFYVLGRKPEGEDMRVFQTFRFAAMIVILAITSSILTYSISRSILDPIERLSTTAKKSVKATLITAVLQIRSMNWGSCPIPLKT